MSRDDLVAEIVAVPQYVRAAKLFRNATFNPHDMYVASPGRRDIEDVVTGAMPTVGTLIQDMRQVRDQEWQALHAVGATIAVDLTANGAASQLSKIGANPVFRVEEGITYGVTKARMPGTRQAELGLAQAGFELCRDLAAAFGRTGALNPEEESAIVSRARKRAGLPSQPR